MIAIPASLRSDFIHIAGTAIHIAPECAIHITGIRIVCEQSEKAVKQREKWYPTKADQPRINGFEASTRSIDDFGHVL